MTEVRKKMYVLMLPPTLSTVLELGQHILLFAIIEYGLIDYKTVVQFKKNPIKI